MSYHPSLFPPLAALPLPFINGTPFALVLFVLYFALFVLPGLAVCSLTFRRAQAKSALPVIVTITASACLGLLAFWIFFFSKTLGRSFCFVVYLSSAALLLRFSRDKVNALAVLRSVLSPLVYAVGTGLLYTAFFFVPSKSVGSDPELPASRFFGPGLPEDNLIPLFLADRIYDRRPLRPFCCGGWLSSDRPPLESGVFLLQRPLRIGGGKWLHYQLLATALQCLWVCGVWCLLLSLGASETRAKQTLAFLVCSGFLFYNCVYTWPKLFASSLVLSTFAVLIAIVRQGRPATKLEVLTASGSVGLTLMAHPGSVFSFPALAALAFRNRRLVSLRQFALGASVVLCLVLPWSAYQRWVDPPGDRLMKMHLGDEPDPTSRSTFQVIRDAYRKHSAGEIVRFKSSNLALLFGRHPWDLVGLDAVRVRPELHVDGRAAERSRRDQLEYIWNAIGILNVGWLIGFAALVRRRAESAVPFAPWLIVAGVVNLTIWSLVMFGPGATITTHSSYADILLLSVGLLGWIFTLPRFAVAIVFSIQAANFLLVWVWPR